MFFFSPLNEGDAEKTLPTAGRMRFCRQALSVVQGRPLLLRTLAGLVSTEQRVPLPFLIFANFRMVPTETQITGAIETLVELLGSLRTLL